MNDGVETIARLEVSLEGRMTSDRVTKSIRQDWDERARKNAFYYIASWRSDWDLDSFFESGEDDYKRLVEPIQRDLAEDGPRGGVENKLMAFGPVRDHG